MTSRPERVPFDRRLLPGIAAIALFALMAAVFLSADGAALIGIESTIPTESFVVALLIIAIALDAALDGALMLAKRDEESGGEPMADGGRGPHSDAETGTGGDR